MRYEDFLTRVRDAGDIADRDHAEQATRATLEVLGQRLSGGQAADVARHLPTELRDSLRAHPGDAEAFDVDEFLSTVAAREARECGTETAREHAWAVLTTIVSTVPASEVDSFRSQLPPGYDQLLRSSSGTRTAIYESSDIDRYLSDTDFPGAATRLAGLADRAGAPEQLQAMLRSFGNQQFDGPAQVADALSRNLT